MSRLAESIAVRRGIVVAAMVLGPIGIRSASAQQSVTMTLPITVNFLVTDAGESTDGSTTTISFANAALDSGKVLRVWVKADAANFTPPTAGGLSIPSSKISWTVTGAHNGIGSSGTLSSVSYTLVFQSDVGQTSGWVDLDWSLAAPDGGIRSGNHQVTVRWKLEAVAP